jgi:diguanylate cyclase (GGDEF)-like protein
VVRLLLFLVVPILVAGTPQRLLAQPFRELTKVHDVRVLSSDEARQGRPVRLRGVVTVVSGWKFSFFLQDATSGISVERSSDLPELKPGQMVEVRGVTGPGKFAPVVKAQSVTIFGAGKMPATRVYGFDQLTGGEQDSQWLAIRGIVRSAAVKRSWGSPVLFLEVDVGAGNLVTVRIIHDFYKASWDRLPGSLVLVQGVCGTVFNNNRQFVGLRIFASDLGSVRVEKPAPVDPFDMPVQSVDSLLQFGFRQGAISRIKIGGTVTYTHPGQGLYIQDGSEGVFARSVQTTAVAQGTRVEVVGYPAAGRYSPQLEDAVFRVVGAGPPVAGLPKTAASIIVDDDGFSIAPYDSVLVQLKGRLVEEIPGADEDLLLLQEGATVFAARLDQSGGTRSNLNAGSLISVTGICAAKADAARDASAFDILLRSPSDIVVLEPAPWWTASHAGWVVALLLLTVLGMSGWLAIARRQAGLRELAMTDPLTGLYNRRGFLLFAEQQRQLALRTRASFLLFYIDVDRFKEINDNLGHQEGDLALKTVSAILHECFRKMDVIGRLGGDEFAVTAFHASDSSPALLEQRLVDTVRRANKRLFGYQLSLSVGILTCDKLLETLPIEELLVQADALMYQQKRDRADACVMSLTNGIRVAGNESDVSIFRRDAGPIFLKSGESSLPPQN